MDLRQTLIATASPSTTTTTTTSAAADPMTSWYSSLSLARSRISLLSSLLPSSLSLSSLSDSDRPALSLLTSPDAYSAVSLSLSSPSNSSPLCHWLYDTYLSSDPNLRLVVLSFVPVLSHLYLSLLHASTHKSLAGFEAVLLSLYAHEVKSRAGNPVLVTIPDLSLPSLYHTPRSNPSPNPNSKIQSRPLIGVISPPLEPQNAVKSTKRACIVGVALDCYFKQISQMPFWSKLDLCKFVAEWAGQDCPCKDEFDHTDGEIVVHEMGRLGIGENGENEEIGEMGSLKITENGENEEIGEMGSLKITENGENGENGEMGSFKIGENGENEENGEMGSLKIGENGEIVTRNARILLPWEILQPVLRILGHCLLAPLNVPEVKEAAGVAVRCLYARASHDLAPQAILATRSLIQLDKRAREAERAAMVASASSKVNTPSKAKRPEMLLVSK